MNCLRCGSTHFEEENGLFYCTFCQTQSQGFTQTETEFSDALFRAKEITSKKPKRTQRDKRDTRDTGTLMWTTAEAFNIILIKQMIKLYEINANEIDFKDLKRLTSLIWFRYLRNTGLAFTDNETSNPRAIHPASRFRDIQILNNKCETLPHFKNGSTVLGFNDVFRLGSDGVVRTVEEMEFVNDLVYYPFRDINSEEEYRDPRKYFKPKSHEFKVSKETQKKLKKLLSELDLMSSFKHTIEEMGFCDQRPYNSEFVFDDSDSSSSEEMPSKKSKSDNEFDQTLNDREYNECDDWFENDSNFDDYDKEVIRHLDKRTKLMAKYIPLSYLRKSRNINSNYFIDLISLPKLLAMLNISNRLLRYDIYCFDLIRWVIEGHIPYSNCLTILPEDWLYISNDFLTFTSNYYPSYNTIHRLSAKIAKYIDIEYFPRPDLQKLMLRFIKDFNLPKDIAILIEDNYNLFEYFDNVLEPNSGKCASMECLPFYERYTLMSIIIVLKRLFVLDDITEKNLSYLTKENIFIWDEWEKYTRLRIELIRSYFTAFYSVNLEDIRSFDMFAEHSNRYNNLIQEKTFFDNKVKFQNFDFRNELQSDFQHLFINQTNFGSSQPLTPSLYPLTNATNYALKQINCNSIETMLSIDFNDKLITPNGCNHGNAFHRGYSQVSKDVNSWSSSFRLLMELSSIVLHCNYDQLLVTIGKIEKQYFSLQSNPTMN